MTEAPPSNHFITVNCLIVTGVRVWSHVDWQLEERTDRRPSEVGGGAPGEEGKGHRRSGPGVHDPEIAKLQTNLKYVQSTGHSQVFKY